MNIKQAKEQIKNAMIAYFSKDKRGNYIVPVRKQRPVFLMGPPGIGKTAIMEQIAQELNVGLVSYSMTHHTRQSAIGLPFINSKVYDGKEYNISEYSMSEIIASVYDMMELSGRKEGILFLDEINCVSETLAPSMLQFLQYKVFGGHQVPDGWIVVTAGNPPEYNNSVREFDIVTWDRLKRVDIEPDYDVWKEYAYIEGIHPAVISYLDTKKNDFYKIENSVDGMKFVTARGWDDLSQMIKLYEANNLKVDKHLIGQYLQNKSIARSFAVYYDLFNKYRSDYQIDKIIIGAQDESIEYRAKKARFDERLSLLSLLIEKLGYDAKSMLMLFDLLKELSVRVKDMLKQIKTKNASPDKLVNSQISKIEKAINLSKSTNNLSSEKIDLHYAMVDFFTAVLPKIAESKDNDDALAILTKSYNDKLAEAKKSAAEVKKHYSNAFLFCEKVFGEGQEILILVTELTTNQITAKYIAQYGCDEYFSHNKELLFYERQCEIIDELAVLDLKNLDIEV